MNGELVICPLCGHRWRRKTNGYSINAKPYQGDLCTTCRYERESRGGDPRW